MSKTLDTFTGERIAFWSRGNRPTQEAFGISAREAYLHLRALYLLADRVAAAASNYFESESTRDVIRHITPLLAERSVLFFVNEDIENFTEHGLRKIEKSPAGLAPYNDVGQVKAFGQQLDSRSEVLHRPSRDISGKIVDLWLQELENPDGQGLYELVHAPNIGGNSDQDYWTNFLIDLARYRRGDFVWEYVAPALREANFSADSMPKIKLRLAQLYTQVTAETLGAYLDAPRHSAMATPLTSTSEFDTELFIICLRCIGVFDEFESCSIEQLVELKASVGWRVFRSFYTDIIRYAISLPRDMRDIVPILIRAESLGWDSGGNVAPTTRQEFVQALVAMLQIVRKRGSGSSYRRLADRLYSVVEAFGDGAFTLLQNSLADVRRKAVVRDRPTLTNVSKFRLNGFKGASVIDIRSFIVHGHDVTSVLSLKDFVQNRLGWIEPVILAQQPSQGLTIIEKFEQHARNADVVFVLLTPDDMGEPGASGRARQNVIFEMGYFVGHFGRRSGRVILLAKGALELPSDLHGVIYIDISNGIMAAAEEIRREVASLTS